MMFYKLDRVLLLENFNPSALEKGDRDNYFEHCYVFKK